jgi:hypothetical protein
MPEHADPDAPPTISQEDLDAITSGAADAGAIARVTRQLASSARVAGTRAVASGRFLATTLIDVAPRIKVRDLATLQDHHGGLQGAELAEALVRNASRASAAVGAASGALVSAQHFAPPTWIAWPIELIVETLAVAAIELRLVAELHEVFGRPLVGSPTERGAALVRAWAERRGVSPATLARPGGLAEVLGRGTRHELVRKVQRRLLARLGRNVSTLAPMLAGAVAAAEVNRRATRSLGEAVARDMAASSTSPGPVQL